MTGAVLSYDSVQVAFAGYACSRSPYTNFMQICKMLKAFRWTHHASVKSCLYIVTGPMVYVLVKVCRQGTFFFRVGVA